MSLVQYFSHQYTHHFSLTMETESSNNVAPIMNLDAFVMKSRVFNGFELQKLVSDVLESREVFVFGELLQEPNIQNLKASGPDGLKCYRALELFAYGTITDYLQNKNEFPTLSERQLNKLRMLTMVSLASHSKVLAYDDIFKALDLHDTRVVEDLIIDTIYSGLIEGVMNQQKRRFEVETFASRDVREQDLDFMLQTLGAFAATSESIVSKLQGEVAGVALSYDKFKRQVSETEYDLFLHFVPAHVFHVLLLFEADFKECKGSNARWRLNGERRRPTGGWGTDAPVSARGLQPINQK